MHVTTSWARRSVATVLLLAAGMLAASLLVGTTTVADATGHVPDGPYPVLVDGNPKCSDYGLTEVTRFEAPTGAVGDTLTQDGVTITVTDTTGGPLAAFDWTSRTHIAMVLVKASNAANLYHFDPAVRSGSAETVGQHGVSHASFCEGEAPPPTINPAASLVDDCDGLTITLDNRGSDQAVTYTVTVDGEVTDHTVAAGDTDTVDVALDEDTTWTATITADGMTDVTADGTIDCVAPPDDTDQQPPDDTDQQPAGGTDEQPAPEPAPEAPAPEPETDVEADTVEQPEPAPAAPAAPAPEPEADVEPEAAPQELAATGITGLGLLVLALMLAGVGATFLLVPAPSEDRGTT